MEESNAPLDGARAAQEGGKGGNMGRIIWLAVAAAALLALAAALGVVEVAA